MSLVHASIVPDNTEILTTQSDFLSGMKELEGELYFMQPDVLVVLSPLAHSAVHPGVEINLSDTIACLNADGTPGKVLHTDMELAVHFKDAITRSGSDHTSLSAFTMLPHDTQTVVEKLSEHLPNMRIVDIRVSPFEADFEPESAMHFGEMLGKEAVATNKRVAIVAIGNFGGAQDTQSLYAFVKTALSESNLSLLDTYSNDKAETLGATVFAPLLVFAHAFHSESGRHTIMTEKVIDGRGYYIVNSAVQ